jgi:hypothetical protein
LARRSEGNGRPKYRSCHRTESIRSGDECIHCECRSDLEARCRRSQSHRRGHPARRPRTPGVGEGLPQSEGKGDVRTCPRRLDQDRFCSRATNGRGHTFLKGIVDDPNGTNEHPTRTEGARGPVTTPAPPGVREVLRSPSQPLEAETRCGDEPRFGHDFGKVRIHADRQAGESAHAIDARAYGGNGGLWSGQYAPGLPSTRAAGARVGAWSAGQPRRTHRAPSALQLTRRTRRAAVQDVPLRRPNAELSAARPAVQRQPAPPSGKRRTSSPTRWL